MSDNVSYELQQIQSTLAALTERLAASTATQVGGMQMYIAVGWSPIIALTDDGTYYYAQIIDWTGGSGIKPPVLQYLCETGWTYNVAEAARVGIVGGGIPDGDKGDITVASGVWTIDNGVVTTAKMGGDVTTAGKAMLTAADGPAQLALIGADPAGAATTAQAAAEATAAGALASHVSAADPHTGYQQESEKGVANGYAPLGADNLVPPIHLPSSGGGANVQRFTTAGAHTWTNPSPSTPRLVHYYIRGGAGGGGSGRKGAAGSVRCGGGGGAAGSVNEGQCWTTDLPGTVAVTVGAGGSGGAGVSTDDTNGNAGLSGAHSLFGVYVGSLGGGGSGGTNASGVYGFPTAAGCAIFGNAGFNGSFGGTASVTGGIGANGQATNQVMPTGGGAGGGLTTADVPGAGGTGGARGLPTYAYSVGGYGGLHVFNPSINGIAGAAPGPTVAGRDGLGGGGGAAALTGTAGNGGNGSAPSGGGGGGGAAANGVGNTSGAGGTGAQGYVEITVF